MGIVDVDAVVEAFYVPDERPVVDVYGTSDGAAEQLYAVEERGCCTDEHIARNVRGRSQLSKETLRQEGCIELVRLRSTRDNGPKAKRVGQGDVAQGLKGVVESSVTRGCLDDRPERT